MMFWIFPHNKWTCLFVCFFNLNFLVNKYIWLIIYIYNFFSAVLFLACLHVFMAIQGLAPHRESSQLHPADCNPGKFSLHNYPTQYDDGPLLITHSSFSRGAMSAISEQSSRGNQSSDSNINDSKQPLSFSRFPSVCGPEKPRIRPSHLDHLNSHAPVRQKKRHVASLSICITPRHQTEARYTQTLSLSPHTPPKRKDPLDSRTVFHPSPPPAVQQVVFMFIFIVAIPST